MEAMEAREELHEASTIRARSKRSPRRRAKSMQKALGGLPQFVLGKRQARHQKGAPSPALPRQVRRGGAGATHNLERQGMSLLEIHEPGETPLPHAGEGDAGGRHRSRHDQLRGRDRARGQARGAARRDRQGAGAVGRGLSVGRRRAGRRRGAPADGAGADERRRLGEAPDGPRRGRPSRRGRRAALRDRAGQRRDRHGEAARSAARRARRSRSRPRS